MRVDVALSPRELRRPGLGGRSVVVIDVFRAATTMATALANGCRMIIPVPTVREARARARDFSSGEALLGGERGGEAIAGFHLGNSPLEYTPERVGGKVVVLTTSNGTRAMVRASAAAAVAVAGLVNLRAIAEWVRGEQRDLSLLCAGQGGEPSLEDTVCAGLIVEQLGGGAGSLELVDAATIALGVARQYRHRLDDLGRDAGWGRRLARAGAEQDLPACLALDQCPLVPLLRDGVVRAAFP